MAFIGRSNVGKSSLINALLGRKSLARTSRTPGKTTMANVYCVDDCYYLVDLPGYGYARTSKAERGRFSRLIRRYIESRDTLSGVVWLLDIRRDPSPDDLAMADLLSRRERPVLVAVTKADKVNRGSRKPRMEAILNVVRVSAEQCVVTSATTKAGIGDLRDSVSQLVREDRRYEEHR